LLLGLRSPVVNGHALVVPLKLRDQNAALNFDNLEVEGSKAIRLPLSGAGIRSIEYVESRKAFFLITGAGPNSERMDFKTWDWTGTGQPRRCVNSKRSTAVSSLKALPAFQTAREIFSPSCSTRAVMPLRTDIRSSTRSKIRLTAEDPMNSFYRAVPAPGVLLFLLFATASAQDASTYTELPRFQQVSEKLYRSGQPRTGGLTRLRELGINTIINLRGTSKSTRAEETEARALGFNYFNVALPNWGRPQDTRVERILALIAAPENGKVLVHCKDGVDRTGMIVAIYRMTHDGLTGNEALVEAERSGMRRIQFWMRDYVEDYGDRVAKLGPESALKSRPSADDFDDHIGDGMRIVERETVRARKVTRRFLRKFSGSLR
jgi:protein tyrosine phosphatase (PTP) superfamily phosphohydrolase (DUF442 family)